MGALLWALAAGAKGEGQIVLLEGEAGIGKTALLELAVTMAEAGGFRSFSGAAEELERHRPFGAVADALGIGRRARAGRPEVPDGDDHRLLERRAEIARLIASDWQPSRLWTGPPLPPAPHPGPPHPAGPQPARSPDPGGWELAGSPTGTVTATLDPARSEPAGTMTRAGGRPPEPAPGDVFSAGPPGDEFRIVDALIDFVERLCSHRPVMLALDDLQWADPSTLLTLNRLAREIQRLPCVVMATLRPLPRSPELQSLVDGLAFRGATCLQIGRLNAEDIAALAGEVLGARPGQTLLGQLARTGGNPFLVKELLATYRSDGMITEEGGLVEIAAGAGLPASLTSMIRHRLGYLDAATIETLQFASVLGSTFSITDLAAVVDRSPASLLRHLRAASQAGILSGASRLMSFRHDLIREALYREMPLAFRHSLHLAAANALLEAGLPAEEVAEHVVRGAAPGDLEAVEWLRSAARQASSRSPAIAAELLYQARSLIPEPCPLLDATQTELTVNLLVAGHLVEAEAIARQVLAAEHDPAVEGALRLCLVQAGVGKGQLEATLREIDAAIQSETLSRQERARLWGWASTCRVILWDLEGAERDSLTALAQCREIDDDFGATIALAGLAAIENLRGRLREGLALGESALAVARRSRSPEARRLQLTLMHALMLIDIDEVEEARHVLRRGRISRERRGAHWNLPSYHFVSALEKYVSGEWDEAIAQFDSAMDFAREVIVYQGQLVGHALRSLIALHRGDLALAEEEVQAAEADWDRSGPQWRPDWMLWARALLTEASGNVPAALATLRKAWELCRDAGVVAEYPVIGPDLARLALACRDRPLAEEVTVALEALAERAGVTGVRGAALRCRGLLTGDAETLVAAAGAYRSSPRRRERGLACEDAAVALAAAGRSAEARPLAEEALEVYRALDARRDCSRAQARLRAAGLRTGSRGERPRPRQGWESLTEAEVEVAIRVAEGLSNPEIARRLFVSRRTVQSHVSHILEKLGLSSRVELAVATSRWQSPSLPVESDEC
jgi:DNA-binding CsgD family transcriptional regulator